METVVVKEVAGEPVQGVGFMISDEQQKLWICVNGVSMLRIWTMHGKIHIEERFTIEGESAMWHTWRPK